ncbi:MAG: ABC transporter ATP-binding protein [Bacillota bacterium]
MSDKPIAVELKNITKRFGSFCANDDISLTVRAGEVHGLLGENGAGKSTLMNVLYGMLKPDHGEIIVKGEPRIIRGPHDAMSLGIQMVHQHFMLAHPYKAWENVVLGEEPTIAKLFIDVKKSNKEVLRAAALCDFNIDPFETVEKMPVAMRQKLEIVRALYHKCDVLILDEPTAVLSVQESDELLDVMRKLRAEGTAIILITHKLREAMQICDNITVLRHGQVVETRPVSEVTPESLATAMVGRPVLFELPGRAPVTPDIALSVEDVSTGCTKRDLKNISFQIHKGEIFGVAGVEGNGQNALVESLVGLQKLSGGKITLNGTPFCQLSADKRVKRIAHIAEDRHAQGYLSNFSVLENVMLGRQKEGKFRKGLLVNKKALIEQANEIVKDFDVRTTSIYEAAGSLSGGNQQKLLVGREFTKPEAELVIAEHPSRGLDIASSEYVQRCLVEMRNKGCCVLLITADLDELLSLSDRIGVMYEGKMVAVGNAEEFPPRVLGLYMTGGCV